MSPPRPRRLRRREFLEKMGAAAGLAAASPPARERAVEPSAADSLRGAEGLAIVVDPGDAVASSPPGRWAADLLGRACETRGLKTRVCRTLDEVKATEIGLLAAGSATGAARAPLQQAGVHPLDTPESFALTVAARATRSLLVATAPDPRGIAYALTELKDRVECAREPGEAFRASRNAVERPACRIRGVSRLFVSDVEDKTWFHDRSFWPDYLDMLVTQRFNRVNLAFGIGYDFARQLRDTYLYFAYPFLLSVPGYDVRARGLDPRERDLNLDSLRFVSEEADRRGLHFQLGLWTHAFAWTDSPEVNYVIDGLSRDRHPAYCRDAVRALLEACPAIRGLTIRTHGESGVPEGEAGRYEFWQALFEGVARAGRPLEIDLHAKGVDQRIVDLALATGLPVRVSPKFWAEHMGLPYLQSSIRSLELPTDEPRADRLMALSTGTRNHMRYSYGDLFLKDRRYGILHRVWPGTQRLLLWGDPAYAAQMGRSFHAHGADGVEYMEPLSFKGRKGSGQAGGREAYADASLRAAGADWRKYEYTYRLWGRLAYDPDADPEGWRRRLRFDFGEAAEPVESALAKASRILPLVSSAHCPSAANNNYWPEMYSNMSLFDAVNRGSYSDTPTPRVFGAVSSLDPQLFASIEECAESLLGGEPLAKVTPPEVARQLDIWAVASSADLAQAEARRPDPSDPRYRRLRTDCAIAAGLGRFFAAKLRAGVLFAIFDRTGDARVRDEARDQYRLARGAWAELAAGPASAYVRDVTFGFDSHLRGHWQDRLAAIDRDLAGVQAFAPRNAGRAVARESVKAAVASVLAPPPRPSVAIEHEAPAAFSPGEALPLQVRGADASSVLLRYRHLNQAETYKSAAMARDGASWRALVPADYLRTSYPLQYYFEVRSGAGVALWPGFASDFLGRPYLAVEPS